MPHARALGRLALVWDPTAARPKGLEALADPRYRTISIANPEATVSSGSDMNQESVGIPVTVDPWMGEGPDGIWGGALVTKLNDGEVDHSPQTLVVERDLIWYS